MVKYYKIKVDIYGDILNVYIGDTTLEAIKKVEKEYEVTFEDECEYFDALTTTLKYTKLGRYDHILMIPKNCKNSTLAHEMIHSAWDILDDHKVNIDPDNHEALTYLVGYLFEEVEKILKKHGSNSKNNKKLK